MKDIQNVGKASIGVWCRHVGDNGNLLIGNGSGMPMEESPGKSCFCCFKVPPFTAALT